MPAGGARNLSQIYFRLRAGSWSGTCGEVLTTFGPPSAWVSPWVLISDSSIRKNFSASMAVSRSLVFRRCNATKPGFQAVFAEVQNGFFAWMICFVAFLSAKPDHGIVRAGGPGRRASAVKPLNCKAIY